jgi:two-component system cell cycle sensor histidine kinase/response regulator CckA
MQSDDAPSPALPPEVFAEALERFPDAVTLSRAVRDEKGRAVDMVLLWMNGVARSGQPDPGAALGHTCSELWPQMVKNGSFGACMRVLDSGVAEEGEFWWTENDTYRPAGYDYKASRIGHDLLLWVLRDSSAKVKQAVAREGRLRALFDAAPTALAELDGKGKTMLSNAALSRLLGRRADVPADLLAACHPEDVARLEAQIAETSGVAGAPTEVRLIADDTRTVWTSVALVEVEAPERMWVAHVQDIGDRVHAQHAARLEAIGQMAGGIAHEFKNLIGIILVNLELILLATSRDDRLRSRIEDAHSAAVDASEIASQLMTFGRRDLAVPEVVDVNQLVLDEQRLLAAALGARIELRVRTSEGGDVCVARRQLSQVLLNLAINARDAMPNGGTLTVSTGQMVLEEQDRSEWPGLEPGVYRCLRVVDTGSGMPKEVAAKAFDPFFSTKPAGRGTGLGLATVHGAVRNAGGDVRLRSEVGHGTEVLILLPTHRAAVPSPMVAERCTRVLVADADPRFAELVRRLLPKEEYEVDAAASVDAARVLAEGQHYDVLFGTVAFWDGGGAQLADDLRAHDRVERVLLASGLADRVVDDGVPVLMKPFSRAELLRAMQDRGALR